MPQASRHRVIQRQADEIAATADERGVTIDQECTTTVVRCIEDQVAMMLHNLLTNAVNYSHDGGVVTVTCGPTADGPRVSVSDRGIGIDPERLPEVFDDYFKTKEALKHNPNSTGIGLAIVKNVARNHHIAVTVESELDRGTTFTLTFPPQE